MILSLKFTLIFLYLAAATHSAVIKNGEVIPTLAKPCRRSQKDINNCLINSIQTIIPKISKDGIKQLDFPPLEPWKVGDFPMNYGIRFLFNVNVSLNNPKLYGLSKFKILRARSKLDDPKNIELEFELFGKNLTIYSDYKVHGTISFIGFDSQGTISVNMTDLGGIMKIKGNLVERDGDQYLQIKHSLWRPTIDDLKIKISSDSDPNSKSIGAIEYLTNTFWKSIFHSYVMNQAEVIADPLFTSLFNTAVLKIPFNQLIPQ